MFMLCAAAAAASLLSTVLTNYERCPSHRPYQRKHADNHRSTAVVLGDDEHTVRTRLTGHLDPIDGKYHWQGTVFGAQVDLPKRPVAIATDARSAQARITEQTPWGSYSIAGIGAPPYEVT